MLILDFKRDWSKEEGSKVKWEHFKVLNDYKTVKIISNQRWFFFHIFFNLPTLTAICWLQSDSIVFHPFILLSTITYLGFFCLCVTVKNCYCSRLLVLGSSVLVYLSPCFVVERVWGLYMVGRNAQILLVGR